MSEPVTYLTNFKDVDPTTLPRYSVSEHQLITSSMQDWYYSYVMGLKPKKTADYFTRGSYLHGLMERYWIARHNNEPFVLEQAGVETRRELMEERQAVVGEVDRLQVESLIARWAKEQDPKAEAVAIIGGVPAIELEFYADIGLRTVDDEPVAFYGFIDLVTIADGVLKIGEHKTASRAWSQTQLQLNLQGPVYAQAVEALTGVTVEEVQFNFFYKDRFESKSIYPTAGNREALVEEMQKGVWLRDVGGIYRSFHWSSAMSPFANLNALELQGIDPTSFIEEHYEVDEDKKAAYERWVRE